MFPGYSCMAETRECLWKYLFRSVHAALLVRARLCLPEPQRCVSDEVRAPTWGRTPARVLATALDLHLQARRRTFKRLYCKKLKHSLHSRDDNSVFVSRWKSRHSFATAAKVIAKQRMLGSTPWAMVNYSFTAFCIFCVIFNLPGFKLLRESWKHSSKLSVTERRQCCMYLNQSMSILPQEALFFNIIIKTLAYLRLGDLVTQRHLLIYRIRNVKTV